MNGPAKGPVWIRVLGQTDHCGDVADELPAVSALATQDDATRMMLDQGHERLVVLDEEGRLVGLLARRALLRALAQESAG